MGTTTRRTVTAALALGACVVAPSLATAAPAVPPGPAALASAGCGQSCVKSAQITPTVGTAQIAVQTYRATEIRVLVRAPSTGPRPGDVVFSATSAGPQTSFAPTATGLRPDTTYAVTVTAKDAQGSVDRRDGTFHTLKAVPLIDTSQAGGVKSAGTGCATNCIVGSKATANLTAAELQVDTAVPAKLVVTAARTAPKATSAGPMFTAPEAKVQTGLGMHWSGKVTKLKEHSKYYVVVRATDEQGRTIVRQGSFKTLTRNVQVRFTDINVTWDAEKGADRGEIAFVAAVDGEWLLSRGEDKIGSDSTVHFAGKGKVDVKDVPRQLEVRVQGFERDGGKLNCFDGGGLGPFPGISGTASGQCGKSYTFDTAVGTIDLGTEAVVKPALPPGYGGSAMFRTRISDQGRTNLNFNVGVEVDVWAS
jgi:hypothetical protein